MKYHWCIIKFIACLFQMNSNKLFKNFYLCLYVSIIIRIKIERIIEDKINYSAIWSRGLFFFTSIYIFREHEMVETNKHVYEKNGSFLSCQGYS